MRHNSATHLAFIAAAASAAARSPDEQSWTPARQTGSSIDHEAQMAQGQSPRPTDGPNALFGRMDLQPRLDGYTLGPLTCGFIASNGNSLVCLSSSTDTCAFQSGYVGCCEVNKDCSRVKTKCINYQSSSAGACNSLTDYHTVCCNVNSPECYTYTLTFSSGNVRTGTYTALDCSPTAGSGKLLDYDPAWSKTHRFPSSTSQTSTSATNTTTQTGDSSSSSNVGAIAGGTVGGVAALALVGVGAFLLLRRRKKSSKSDTSSPAAPSTHMSQTQPPQHHPGGGSPAVPQNYQGYHLGGYSQTQSVYDPRLSAYPQPSPSSPQGSYNPGFPPQQQQQPQGYNLSGNTASYTSSSPPHTTSGPYAAEGYKGATSSHVTSSAVESGQQQPLSELAVQHPVGNEHNRAELGGH